MENNNLNKKRTSFIKLRKYAYVFSILLLVGFSIPVFMGASVNWGIDFAGGIKLQVKLPQGINLQNLKDASKTLGVNATIQGVGTADKNEYMISSGLLQDELVKQLIDQYAPENEKAEMQQKWKDKQPVDTVILLKRGFESLLYKDGKIPDELQNRIDWQNSESVGPAVGSMLRDDGLKLFLVASLFMVFYLSFRFEFRYSVAAMVALLHDLLIISFYVAVTGIEINIPVLAALLTLLGYSINDTIVIFDRIRENSALQSKSPFIETIDGSIWQSMSRTLMTSLTTMVAILTLLIFGGEALKGFSITLFFGLILGTYSSVFVASPVLYDWGKVFSSGKAPKTPVESKFSV